MFHDMQVSLKFSYCGANNNNQPIGSSQDPNFKSSLKKNKKNNLLPALGTFFDPASIFP
jgi:hypothetical protein